MVFEFRHVPADDIRKRLRDVLDENYPDIKASDSALKMFSEAAGGDVRRALNMLEAAINNAEDGEIPEELAEAIIPSNAQSSFDRDGDVHYDLLSCLQKSIRGSDPDAAVFYLARLLEGGDLISPCRRLMVIASEDIGPAYPMAPVIVKACIDCARELGMPEARIPLANAAIILATAPKSNSAICAYDMAAEDIHSGLGSDIPLHLRSPLFKGYKYPHDYPGHWVKQQYLPDTVKDRKYYVPGENKFEKSSKEYLDSVKKSEK
jgi:putative ATPase